MTRRTFIIYNRLGNNNLQIPAVINIHWYIQKAIKHNVYTEFKIIYIKLSSLCSICSQGYPSHARHSPSAIAAMSIS